MAIRSNVGEGSALGGSSVATAGATTSSSQTKNIDPKSLAALQTLIEQLLGGGTPQQIQDRARLQQETQAVQALRGDYSKAAAFSDAQGAINQALERALQSSLPSIVRAAEGAGTSANSMRALLTQQATTDAAQAAAALGLNAASNYGNIGSNLSSILSKLVTTEDPATIALINALQIAKGAVVDSAQQNSGNRGEGSSLGYTGSASAGSGSANLGPGMSSGFNFNTTAAPLSGNGAIGIGPGGGNSISGFSADNALASMTPDQLTSFLNNASGGRYTGGLDSWSRYSF